MTMAELKKKAKAQGVNAGKLKKVELIHQLQQSEGNFPCYGTADGNCDQTECCYRKDCLKATC